eukprot:GHVP01043947.1.p1 GENE.GHVP01043947.1~~GHVP01043947.1.p1  ORF type:complete len:223 (+),score=38.02 GHVP01043947.1:2-670(+)
MYFVALVSFLNFYVSSMAPISGSNLRKMVAKRDVVIVSYGTDWCGYCKILKPVLEGVSKTFEKDNRVGIARIDCDKEVPLCKRKNIRGYPSLRIYVNGLERDYTGGRQEKDFVDIIKRLLNRKSVSIKDGHEKRKLINRYENIIIGEFPNKKCPEYITFMDYFLSNSVDIQLGTEIKECLQSRICFHNKNIKPECTLIDISKESLTKLVTENCKKEDKELDL